MAAPAPLPVPAPRILLDPRIWLGCAGAPDDGSYFPRLGELVYYFPQGHMEQAVCPAGFLNQEELQGRCMCRVMSARLYATAPAPGVEEIYFELTLDPSKTALNAPPSTEAEIVPLPSFSKRLSHTDANGGATFRVPTEWVSYGKLPAFQPDEKAMNLPFVDMYGKTWIFVYKKSTSEAVDNYFTRKSWCRFSNEKLVIGKVDSLVLIYDEANGSRFIGVRRGGKGSSRVGIVPPEEILGAIRGMRMKEPFTVKHFPRYNHPDFVVPCYRANGMNKAVANMSRIRLSMATIMTFDKRPYGPGTIVSRDASFPPWPASQWRALQVNWDCRNPNDYLNYVSAWQVVEHVDAPGEIPDPDSPDEDSQKLKKQKVKSESA